MDKIPVFSMQDSEIKEMLVEYMGKGFLDNIIALFKQDMSLCRFVPDMLGDESLRVRLGATALVEELSGEYVAELRNAVPGIIALLKHGNPTIRGDAAYVLGIIKDESAREALVACLHDSNLSVREVASDALAQIG
ncbi:MAG TPA: HEAT repeat domain-containing protein [Nitrospirota bacterium]|nr:HEAT repeat domain-containing protein [Nitrospirota bacterium]